jgi:hypothetical protein
MTTGGCGCAATAPPTMVGGGIKHRGGSSDMYLSQLVNLAIPVGFILARNALATLNNDSSKQEDDQKGGGSGENGEFTKRLEHVSFRIRNFLRNQNANS